MRKVVVVLAVAGFAASAFAVDEGLYAFSSWTSEVWSIDESTGEATHLTDTTAGSFSGASFLGGEMYGTDIWFDPYEFTVGTIDLDTGAYAYVSDQGGSWNWHGLASSDGAGVLWSIDQDAGNVLTSLAPDGTITSIGSTGVVDGRGMAYDDTNGILYATGGYGSAGATHLYTVDVADGATADLGSTGLDTFLIGLAYDESTQTLYANDGNTGDLYTVSTTDGSATHVGSNLASDVTIDSLAWIPEPASLGLLAIGALLLRRR